MKDRRLTRIGLPSLCFLATGLFAPMALAVGSAEVYTSKSYGYGRFEARMRFAPGDGVVSSFFLWKDGSETAGTFWNELDFEKVGADCHLTTSAIYGNPSAVHSQSHALDADLCGTYHTYAYEWTPEAIVWSVDGAEIRRETGATATAFAENAATAGMQVRFNVWPGDATFGGNFDPSILPVHEYVDWVQFSAYADGGFTVQWREDFNSTALPTGWLSGNWSSPKNLSTHSPRNANLIDGFLVLSLTADNALGPAGAMPDGDAGRTTGAPDAGSTGTGSTSTAGPSGSASSAGTSGSASTAGTAGASGSTSTAGASGSTGTAGATDSAGTAGASGSTGTAGTTDSAGTAGATSTAGSAGTTDSTSTTGSMSTGSAASSSDGSGGCNVSGKKAKVPFGALGLVAIAALRRRRRRSSRP